MSSSSLEINYYPDLLLFVWFNLKDIISDGIGKVMATDTRGYYYKYNALGEKVREELNRILKSASWEYSGPSIYHIDPAKRSGESQIVITLPNEKYILRSDKPFDPKITIAGARTKGDHLYSIDELPDPLGKVQIEKV